MGKMGKFDARDLKEFQKQLEKLQDPNILMKACTKELTANLLKLVVHRTPVGDYSGNAYSCAGELSHSGHKIKGKKGGTLRRGWTSSGVRKEGSTYKGEITNPVEYASYVEYGHRTVNDGWVPGHFVMEKSAQELERIAPVLIEKRLQNYLERMQT